MGTRYHIGSVSRKDSLNASKKATKTWAPAAAREARQPINTASMTKKLFAPQRAYQKCKTGRTK